LPPDKLADERHNSSPAAREGKAEKKLSSCMGEAKEAGKIKKTAVDQEGEKFLLGA